MMPQDARWVPEVYSGFLWLALNRLNGAIEIRECFAIDVTTLNTEEGRADLEETLRWAEVRANALLEALDRPQFRHLANPFGSSILIEHAIVDAASSAPLPSSFFDPEILAYWLGWPPRED